MKKSFASIKTWTRAVELTLKPNTLSLPIFETLDDSVFLLVSPRYIYEDDFRFLIAGLLASYRLLTINIHKNPQIKHLLVHFIVFCSLLKNLVS